MLVWRKLSGGLWFVMKMKYNRVAVLPVMCSDCKMFIWLERYRKAEVFDTKVFRGMYVKKCLCKECVEKYDVGGKK